MNSLSSLRSTARAAQGATYLFIQGFVNAVLGVIYFIVLARALSDHREETGIFALKLIASWLERVVAVVD